MQGQQVIEISEPSDIDRLFKVLDGAATGALNNHKKLYVGYGTDKKMTQAQRGALHVWCQMVADTLNDAGLPHAWTSRMTGIEMEMDWTMSMIKDMQYKPILKKMSDKNSTEQQSTIEPSSVADTLIRIYASKGVVLPPWPSNK